MPEKIAPNRRPNIFEFENYRLFLGDFMNHLRTTRRAFSVRAFTKKAGFSSPGYFQSLINGRRNLSEKGALKIGKAFALSEEEQKFFFLLMEFNQADDAQTAGVAYKKLTKNRNFQKYHPIERAQYDYFSKWYYPVLREMVALDSFREDYEWLGSQLQPPVKALSVQRAFDHLERIGLLSRDDQGRLIQSSSKVTTGSRVESIQVASFHEQMLDRAKTSIFELSEEERELRGIILACNEDDFEKIRKKIDEFRESILNEFGELKPGSDKVFQVSVQLISATKAISKD